MIKTKSKLRDRMLSLNKRLQELKDKSTDEKAKFQIVQSEAKRSMQRDISLKN